MQLQHLAINLIQWGDHMSVDHPGIDAQHKANFVLGLTVAHVANSDMAYCRHLAGHRKAS